MRPSLPPSSESVGATLPRGLEHLGRARPSLVIGLKRPVEIGGESDGLKEILVVRAGAPVRADRQVDMLLQHLAHRHETAAELEVAERVVNDCTPPAADQLDVSVGNPYGMRQRGTRSKKTQAIEHGRGAATIAPVSLDRLDLRLHKVRVKRQGMCLGQITARGEEFIAASFRNNGGDGYSDEALPGSGPPVRYCVLDYAQQLVAIA